MKKIKRDKADAVFSLYIRTRDNWTCQRCGKKYPENSGSLHASHFMGRAKENTRFNELNVDALDFGCHMYLTAHPAIHLEWQIERKGQKVVDDLKLWSGMYKKKDRELDYLYWNARLKEML